MLKRFLAVSFIFMLVLTVVGCNQTEDATSAPEEETTTGEETATQEQAQIEESKYADGIYFAEEEGYSKDWKYTATIEVKDGKIIAAVWNGVNINGGKDKATTSADGEYPMVEKGGAQAEWHEQAALAGAYLVEIQDPEKITYKDDEGHTDDIAGVSIHVVEFFDLAEKALANGPVAEGQYKDGFYYAEESDFTENGYKNFVHIAVRNGSIVGVDFNAHVKEGEYPDKDSLSISGEYGMVAKAGAQSEWHEQVALTEDYLIETQDPAKIAYNDEEGHTDDIAGVSIHVKEFFSLAEQALADAK
ncbi:FMN-binding protein [Bacillus sp. B15-48]|uniref:FMN-binding protein n=1 Tax=Bacillus sp. B15-48 TaxID=1548601 RepID=UPI00193FCE3C|nr:FMN-binding protein [Bacillus sp. B15-48]MBM4763037.1 FMN-binding protein [Bacillus sp. B15-48]